MGRIPLIVNYRHSNLFSIKSSNRLHFNISWQLWISFPFSLFFYLGNLFFMATVSPWCLPDGTNPSRTHTTHTHVAKVNQGRGIEHMTLGSKPKSFANDASFRWVLLLVPMDRSKELFTKNCLIMLT